MSGSSFCGVREPQPHPFHAPEVEAHVIGILALATDPRGRESDESFSPMLDGVDLTRCAAHGEPLIRILQTGVVNAGVPGAGAVIDSLRPRWRPGANDPLAPPNIAPARSLIPTRSGAGGQDNPPALSTGGLSGRPPRRERLLDPIELPAGIDEPPQVLLWRLDDLAPVVLLMVLGIVAGHLAPLLLAGLVGGRLYRRYRDTRPDGYFLHALYWHGLVGLRGWAVPNGLARVWVP